MGLHRWKTELRISLRSTTVPGTTGTHPGSRWNPTAARLSRPTDRTGVVPSRGVAKTTHEGLIHTYEGTLYAHGGTIHLHEGIINSHEGRITTSDGTIHTRAIQGPQMAIDQDVLVVGGGVAGSVAALAATREGADTRLVSHKRSTLRQASGLVDVLGYVDGDGPLPDPLDGLGRLSENHPYSRVGREALEAGLALFDDVAGRAYCGGHTTQNALVPTTAGTLKPTARYPRSMAAGLASDDRDVMLVGFEELPGFDAPLAAAQLDGLGLPCRVRGVTVRFPVEVDADATKTRFAHLLDPTDGEAATGTACRALADRIADSLADRITDSLAEEYRVGLPAVLGREDTQAVRSSLEMALGVDVFELPTGPPSLPGIRLAGLLETALEEAGVRIETGNSVVDVSASDGVVDTAVVDRNGSRVPYAADEFVLATGGLVGQGLDTDRATVREPVFDCHVEAPGDRADWSEPEAFGDHSFPRFGVTIDDRCRPLDGGGRIAYRNVRAAGSVLGNYDLAAEQSGMGVSLATGYLAGTLAGETV